MMQKSELEKRYRSKVRFWFLRFERLSNENDELQTEIERQRKIVDKNSSEIVEVIRELRELQEEKETMEFSNLTLEK